MLMVICSVGWHLKPILYNNNKMTTQLEEDAIGEERVHLTIVPYLKVKTRVAAPTFQGVANCGKTA
jgi:hypothetical protein